MLFSYNFFIYTWEKLNKLKGKENFKATYERAKSTEN